MNRSTSFHLTMASLVVAGFLFYYNSTAHNDYSMILDEIKLVDDQLKISFGNSYQHLENVSKKKRDDALILKDHQSLMNDAWTTLLTPSLVVDDVYNIDRKKLQSQLSPYYSIAMSSKDSILACNYLRMAINQRTQYLADSIVNVKEVAYSTTLVTMNEPLYYRVGEKYPLYFATINTLDEAESQNLKISLNGTLIEMISFPLIYDSPQEQQAFRITESESSLNFFSNNLHSRNHNCSQFIRP